MSDTSPHDRPVRQGCIDDSGPGVLGNRIAALRVELGYTQQELAERVAISRVALSNLESGRSIPGERTVALLAGLFAMEPYDLVRGTSYPPAKVDRLPLVANRYSEVDMQLALLNRDLRWLPRLSPAVSSDLLATWRGVLADLREGTVDQRDRARIADALRRILGSTLVVEDGPAFVE